MVEQLAMRGNKKSVKAYNEIISRDFLKSQNGNKQVPKQFQREVQRQRHCAVKRKAWVSLATQAQTQAQT